MSDEGMGRRKRVKGDEYDAFSKRWRRWVKPARDHMAAIKRRVHKRERAQGKRSTYIPPE